MKRGITLALLAALALGTAIPFTVARANQSNEASGNQTLSSGEFETEE